MTVRAALHAYLTDALVEVSGRIYANKAQDGAVLPYVRYSRVSSARTYFHETFGETFPWVSERFQFDCTGTTPKEAEDVGDALIAVLSGYAGDMEGVRIGDVRVATDFDSYDPTTKLYRRVVDLFVDHEELALESS